MNDLRWVYIIPDLKPRKMDDSRRVNWEAFAGTVKYEVIPNKYKIRHLKAQRAVNREAVDWRNVANVHCPYNRLIKHEPDICKWCLGYVHARMFPFETRKFG